MSIGFQTRIDLWDEESPRPAGTCAYISIECGIESITDAGRDELNKNCHMSTERSDRAADLRARTHSVGAGQPDPDRTRRQKRNPPLAGAPESTRRVGQRTGSHVSFPRHASVRADVRPSRRRGWERAHQHYTSVFGEQGIQRYPGSSGRRRSRTWNARASHRRYHRRSLDLRPRTGDRAGATRSDASPWSALGRFPTRADGMDGRLGRGRFSSYRLPSGVDAGAAQDLEASAEYLRAVVGEVKPDLLHLNQYGYGGLQVDVPKWWWRTATS